MELSWTTFILESVNFLILIWILKRLFYAPVKRMIEERRFAVQKVLDAASTKMSEAEGLHVAYENRMKDWEQEKERARELLSASLEEEKSKQMKQIVKSVAQEQERLRAQEMKKSEELRTKLEKDAMEQALSFMSRLLEQFSTQQIEDKLVDLTLEHLRGAEAKGLPIFRSKPLDQATPIQVRSAFSLNETRRSALLQTMKLGLGTELKIDFQIDPSLLAGVEISYGSSVLQANLRDELKLFSEVQ